MFRKFIYSVSFIFVLSLMCGVGRADVTVAEDLLVDLRGEDLLYGDMSQNMADCQMGR